MARRTHLPLVRRIMAWISSDVFIDALSGFLGIEREEEAAVA
jgi:hypothetical protein